MCYYLQHKSRVPCVRHDTYSHLHYVHMHLVHHSIMVDEQKHNFGFALTIWDRLFGTYRIESILGSESQKIGLAEIDDARPSGFIWSMKQPLT